MARRLTRGQLEEILRVWQQRLELDRWRIELLFDEPTTEDENASLWRSNDYEQATLRLNVEWPTWSKERTNETIVHELLHLATRDVDKAVELLETHVHRDAWGVAETAYLHALEGHVDHLSRRLVAFAGVV